MFNFLVEPILNCHIKSYLETKQTSVNRPAVIDNRANLTEAFHMLPLLLTGKKWIDGSRVSKNKHNNKVVLRSLQQSQGMNWEGQIPGTYIFSKALPINKRIVLMENKIIRAKN